MSPSEAELQRLTRELTLSDVSIVEGTVDWFNPERGYGFMTPDDGGEDVFVRYSSIRSDGFKALEPGQRVRFVRTDDARGPRAMDVELIG